MALSDDANILESPAPGTDLGPCADEGCGHGGCAVARAAAARLCSWCGRQIGYLQYVREPGSVIHAVCHWDRARVRHGHDD